MPRALRVALCCVAGLGSAAFIAWGDWGFLLVVLLSLSAILIAWPSEPAAPSPPLDRPIEAADGPLYWPTNEEANIRPGGQNGTTAPYKLEPREKRRG